MMIDPVFEMVFRLTAAVLLAAAAWHKLRHPHEFWQALAGYRLLPEHLERPFVTLFPLVEGLTALALLVPYTSGGGAYMAIALWGLYGTAIFANLLRGRTEIECGCGGLSTDQHIHMGLVIRNLVLMALLATTLAGSLPREMSWLDNLISLFGSTSFLLLYIAADTLMRNNATFRSEASI